LLPEKIKIAYAVCHFGFHQSIFLIIMSKKYNLLRGASHFLPFFWGEDIRYQYSNTSTNMYCHKSENVGGTVFTFVEMRPLKMKERQSLDAMASNDFIAPTRLFAELPDNGPAHHDLEKQFDIFRLAASAISELLAEVSDSDPESEERMNIEALIECIDEEKYNALNEIEKIINEFNQLSGFNLESGEIQR
jgi:hypothetical protein